MSFGRILTVLALLAVTAACGTTPPESLRRAVSQAQVGGSGQIRVNVHNDTAYLHGYSDYLDRALAARAALRHPDINRVVNVVVQND